MIGRLVLFLVLVGALAGVAAGPGRERLEFAAWWLSAVEPPVVRLELPDRPLRGVVALEPALEPAGRVVIVQAELDGQPLALAGALQLDTTRLPDGEHELALVARDLSLRRNEATARAVFRSDNTPPHLTVELDPPELAEGGTAVVRVRSSEPSRLSAALPGRKEPALRLWQRGEEHWALVGCSPAGPPFWERAAAAGELTVRLEATDEAGNRAETTLTRPVARATSELDHVELPAEYEPLLAPEVREAEETRLWNEVYRVAGGPPRWSGPFLKPADGPVITAFGTRRAYNGGPVAGWHAGVDISAPRGAVVRAPAPATVVLVDRVKLRGLIVVLDHGAGVYTTLAHLDEALVKSGDPVARGQPVARVGSSGLSTGPHLHWELWVGGANVDPIPWTERAFP